MSFPCDLSDLIFRQIQPFERREGNCCEIFYLISWKIKELKLLKFIAVKHIQVGHLIFGSIKPKQVCKTIYNRDICNSVSVYVQISDLFVTKHHRKQPF
jgi:hypothetical protein